MLQFSTKLNKKTNEINETNKINKTITNEINQQFEKRNTSQQYERKNCKELRIQKQEK